MVAPSLLSLRKKSFSLKRSEILRQLLQFKMLIAKKLSTFYHIYEVLLGQLISEVCTFRSVDYR